MSPTDKILYESRLSTRQAINYAFIAGLAVGWGSWALAYFVYVMMR